MVRLSNDDLRRRAWALFILDNSMRMGLIPLSKIRFHRITYFCNCLSGLFQVLPLDTTVVKYVRGPYYPEMQWHLDRLVGAGLATIKDLRYPMDPHGTWMDANYQITKSGALAAEALRKVDDFYSINKFISDIIYSYSAQEEKFLDSLAIFDSTYGNAQKEEGIVIDFSEAIENLSVREADSFEKFAQNPNTLSPQDRTFLYMGYLQQITSDAVRKVG